MARAQYDPAWRWQTLETPHFRLHYHDGEYELAQRCARAAERAHALLTEKLDHDPSGRTEVVLSDETDEANGSATAYLYPTVHLLAAPPDNVDELNDYDDYVWQLVAHEYTHIVHLDNVRGPPEALNWLVGQLDTPNAFQPRWVTEGIAVFEESNLSQGGRERSNLYDMYLRADYLEKQIFSIDQVSHVPTRYPYGSVAYLYGSHFIQFMAEQSGEESLARLSDDYGGRLIPFSLNFSARHAFGDDYLDFYKRWMAELDHHFESELRSIRARAVTPFRAVTHGGNSTGEPHLSPDGEWIYYQEVSADRRPQLRRVRLDGSGDEKLMQLQGSGEIDLARDGSFVVASMPQVYREFETYRDLYRIDLEPNSTSTSLSRLTYGLRASQPDISPDGHEVACVINEGAGKTALALVSLTPGAPAQVIYRPAPGDEVYTPRFSPSGRTLVFSEHRGRFRDLRLLSLETGEVRNLTEDQAIDVDPMFDPSGNWVLFSSDRTGVYDLYALPVNGGAVRTLAHVETGAFHPELAHDERHLVFVTYSSRGFDVATAEVDFSKLPEAPPSRADRGPNPYVESSEVYPSRPYSVWPTILPHYWLPLFSNDAVGPVVGALTSGNDILNKHSYSAEVYWSIVGSELGGQLQYLNNTLYPTLGLSAERGLFPLAGGPAGTLERQTAGDASIQIPFDRIDQSFFLSADYEMRSYEPLYQTPLRPDEPTPFFPDRGRSASIGLAFAYSSALASTNAISLEEGFRFDIGFRGARRFLGGNFEYDSVSAAGQAYLRMPWALHQVLALQLAGGWGEGDLGGRRIFSLGGPTISDPVLGLIQGSTVSTVVLRGYAPGALAGNLFALGSAEYRLPLVDIDHGFWTLPLFFSRLHAALLVDAGEAGQHYDLNSLHVGVGAEVRVNFTVAYALSTQLRLGYARGLSEGGINDVYLVLGSSY